VFSIYVDWVYFGLSPTRSGRREKQSEQESERVGGDGRNENCLKPKGAKRRALDDEQEKIRRRRWRRGRGRVHGMEDGEAVNRRRSQVRFRGGKVATVKSAARKSADPEEHPCEIINLGCADEDNASSTSAYMPNVHDLKPPPELWQTNRFIVSDRYGKACSPMLSSM
jgi:hypothetical protein